LTQHTGLPPMPSAEPTGGGRPRRPRKP